MIRAITDADVAVFLASKKRKKRKISRQSKPEEIARSFSEQLHIKNLYEILRQGTTPINLAWIVNKWLDMLDDRNTNSSVKMSILDRLRELILIGAVQDPELIESITQKTAIPSSKKKKSADPFAGDALKFRGVS